MSHKFRPPRESIKDTQQCKQERIFPRTLWWWWWCCRQNRLPQSILLPPSQVTTSRVANRSPYPQGSAQCFQIQSGHRKVDVNTFFDPYMFFMCFCSLGIMFMVFRHWKFTITWILQLYIWSNIWKGDIALRAFHYSRLNGTKCRKSNVVPPLSSVAPDL